MKREEAKVDFENLESYIKSLNIKLDIYVNDQAIVPRISQMTQKTNQFNLTTKRYTEADIQKFVDYPEYVVVAIGVSDKFGDNGITGLAIIKTYDKKAEIETLLLSCRIIGRNIENRFIDYLIELLKQKGVKKLSASYLRTLKNAQVLNFYDELGFKLVNVKNENKQYAIKLIDYKPHIINYMQIKNGR